MQSIVVFFLVTAFLCWGSFLAATAHRLLHRKKFLSKRSRCPKCRRIIAWYDLLPVVSFFILLGQCRHCKKKISWIYPTIEFITAVCMITLWHTVPTHYFGAYFVLFSGLIISIATDLEKMVFLRIITLGLIPIGLICSIFSWLPITPIQSIAGTLFGYGLLWSINRLFILIKKRPGLGEGDFELLAAIGSFIGITGCWFTLMIASWSATLYAVGLVLYTRKVPKGTLKIPFGPFLGLGTLGTVIFSQTLIDIFF